MDANVAPRSTRLLGIIDDLNQKFPPLKLINVSNAVSAYDKVGQAQKLTAALTNSLDHKKHHINALKATKLLTEKADPSLEPYIVQLMPHVMNNFAAGGNHEKTLAEDCGWCMLRKIAPHGLSLGLSVLLDGMASSKWQVKQGSMQLLDKLSASHPKAMHSHLPEITSNFIDCMQDTKPEVVKSARTVFTQLCQRVVSNADIVPIVPKLINAYANPVAETASILDTLIETTFVATVDRQTLGVLVPVLRRGLMERQPGFKRKAAIIIGNMCKLVVDPQDAAFIYPILEPMLRKAAEELAFEEIVKVCNDTLASLRGVMGTIGTSLQGNVHSVEELQSLLKMTIVSAMGDATWKEDEYTLKYVATAIDYLRVQRASDCVKKVHIVPCLALMIPKAKAESVVEEVHNQFSNDAPDTAEVDHDVDMCNIEFSLGYGGKVLLRNTRFWLKRGHRYGLVGPNGVGKSTLLRSIALGNVEGFPENIKTAYVQNLTPEDKDHMTVKAYMMEGAEVSSSDAAVMQGILTELGFSGDMQNGTLDALSGGWCMRLAVARSMFTKADLLLMDEPTNHLDVNGVAWLENHLKSAKDVTCLIVSHSQDFLAHVATDIIHYKDLKLTPYPGTISTFLDAHPDQKSRYGLGTSFDIKFPLPGRLDGVRTKAKIILKATNVTFTYPGNAKATLTDVGIKASLGSRILIMGENGAGKSTLLKLLVGEILPNKGEIWKHQNLRLAYVAQHSFHHLEVHMESSPVEYIQWRYKDGVDRETMARQGMQKEGGEESSTSNGLGPRKIEAICGRRTRSKVLEYEVKFVGRPEKDNKYLTRQQLEEMGAGHLVKQMDEKVASEAAGVDLRPLTTPELQGHCNDFGLVEEFAVHSKIKRLSGGQKVKLVLAAAMWNRPHVLILDEPTNFLDTEAMAALTAALKEFQGGIILISHDVSFQSALCPEIWHVQNGKVSVGGSDMQEDGTVRVATNAKAKEEDTEENKRDKAGGNTNAAAKKAVPTDFWGRPLSKKEIRAMKAAGSVGS